MTDYTLVTKIEDGSVEGFYLENPEDNAIQTYEQRPAHPADTEAEFLRPTHA